MNPALKTDSNLASDLPLDRSDASYDSDAPLDAAAPKKRARRFAKVSDLHQTESLPAVPVMVNREQKMTRMVTGGAASNSTAPAASGPPRFEVCPDELVVVDGRMGFDTLDLSDFSIGNVRFEGNVITISDGDEQFSIRHRNIRSAFFANDVSVDL